MRPALIHKRRAHFLFLGLVDRQSAAINCSCDGRSSIGCSFDAKCEAAGSRAVHLQIIDFAVCKQARDYGLECSINNIFLCDQASTSGISLERACASAKLVWETTQLIVSGTFFCVHVNWSGLRQFFHAIESVIGEQYGVIHLRSNQAQAMTAWRRVGC